MPRARPRSAEEWSVIREQCSAPANHTTLCMAAPPTRQSRACPSCAPPAPRRACRSPASWTCRGQAARDVQRPHRVSSTTMTRRSRHCS
eukprot:3959408-Heterocapsa_arctica.AAC.1